MGIKIGHSRRLLSPSLRKHKLCFYLLDELGIIAPILFAALEYFTQQKHAKLCVSKLPEAAVPETYNYAQHYQRAENIFFLPLFLGFNNKSGF